MKSFLSRHKGDDSLGTAELPSAMQENPDITARDQESPEPGFPETPGNSRTFHLQYSSCWDLHTTIHVNDNEQLRELYTVDGRNRKPQMKIRSHASNTEVATVDFHAFKTRIDVTLHGHPLALESGGLATRYSYTSPALNGDKMTWRPRKKLDDLNMVLLNGHGLAIARFKPEYMGLKRGGLLELLPECWKTEQVLEEVIVVALAVTHYKQSQRIVTAMAPVGT